MNVSVVIPTHNQRERLGLVLHGLAGQACPGLEFEVLVIDDGCTDGTEGVVAGFQVRRELNVRLVRGIGRQGRCRARNRGLQEAVGELTVFLDGDALPAPDLVARYWQAHRAAAGPVVLSGMQCHLAELEYFQDPQRGVLVDGVDIPSVVRDSLAARLDDLVVTEALVRSDFGRIHRRSQAGSYPNEGTVRRQEEARALLRERPDSAVGWLAFIPHNGAASTELLRAAEGFDSDIPFSEGWELAYRLQRHHGARVQPVEASTYHLYHHHDFSDPDQARTRYDAIEYMAAKHRDPRIRLVYFWYAHLWADPFIPDTTVVEDLFEFDRQYAELPDDLWLQYETVLRNHPNQLSLKPVEAHHGIQTR